MPTKSYSARPSKRSSAASRKPETPAARRLVKSLGELKAHLEGKRKLAVYSYEISDPIDVRAIRKKIGLSQAEFATRFAIGPRALQDWEQGRRVPDTTVRAYLTVIARNPQAVEAALRDR